MKIASCVLAAASFFAASAYAFNEGAVALHESNENDPDNGMMGAWFSSKQLPLNKLQEQFPSVHSATVQRFYSAFGQESTKMLAAYTDWKKTRVRPSTGDDASDWKQAMAESFSYYAVRGNLRGSSDSAEKGAPPEQQVMFATGLTDKEGYSVFQLLPARMDLGFDRSQEVYANSVSSYIETKLENNPPEVTVLIDARAGRGWPNPEMTRYVHFLVPRDEVDCSG